MNKVRKSAAAPGIRRTVKLKEYHSDNGRRAPADTGRKYPREWADLDLAVDQLAVKFSFSFAALLELPVLVMDALKRSA